MVAIGIVTILVGLTVFVSRQIHLGRVEEIATWQRGFDNMMHWNRKDDRWLQTILDTPYDWETEEQPIIDAAYGQGVTVAA